MGYDQRLTAAGVPILGQAFKIVTHWPTVIIQCQCEDGVILSLIGGKGTAIACPSCGNVYGIGEVGKIQVGLVAKKAAEPQPVS
jgi:hypothetical protein